MLKIINNNAEIKNKINGNRVLDMELLEEILDGANENEIEIKEGYVLIDIKHTLDEHDIVTLETIIRQLETISESNSKHIQIVRKEY